MKKFVSRGLIALLTAGLLGVAGTNIHADSIFVNPPSINHQIQQVNNDNGLTYFDDFSLNNLNNHPPKVSTGHKYARTQLNFNENNPTHTYLTTPNSQQSNAFTTKWFLPDGFNITRGEHGNYQSVAIAGNNLYLVESMGKNTNQGAIIKYNMDDLNKLGLLNSGNQDKIWKAFTYFNPYTRAGKKNNKKFIRDDTNVQNHEGEISNLNKKINSYNAKLNFQNRAKQSASQQVDHFKDLKNAKRYKSNKNNSKNSDFKKFVNSKLQKWQASQSKHEQNIKNDKKVLHDLSDNVEKENQDIGLIKANNPNSFEYAKIEHTAQLSPLLDIGHGQTLAYNPARKSLFLAQDDTTSDLPSNGSNQLTEIDPNNLQPLRQYHFKMLHGNSNFQLHTLAFDKDGYAYMGRNYGKNRYRFFRGTLDNNFINFQSEPQTVRRPKSSVNQYLSYNPANNRLYFVTNDNLTSLPVDKLNDGDLKSNDIHYTTFNTGREFEGLGFDSQGYGYMLMLWKPEIMKSSFPMQ